VEWMAGLYENKGNSAAKGSLACRLLINLKRGELQRGVDPSLKDRRSWIKPETSQHR